MRLRRNTTQPLEVSISLDGGKNVYRVGEKVSGIVELITTSTPDKLTVNCLSINMVGKEVILNKHDKIETFYFLSKSAVLVSQQEEPLFPDTSYEYHFEFELPKDIPPSLTLDCCGVQYGLCVTLSLSKVNSKKDKSESVFKSRKLVVLKSFNQVENILDIPSKIEQSEQTTFLLRKGILGFKFLVTPSVLYKGTNPLENINVMIEYDNQSSKRVNAVTLYVVRVVSLRIGEQTIRKKHRVEDSKKTFNIRVNPRDKTKINMSLAIPVNKLPNSFDGKKIDVHYFIVVKQRVVLGKRVKSKIPIEVFDAVSEARRESLQITDLYGFLDQNQCSPKNEDNSATIFRDLGSEDLESLAEVLSPRKNSMGILSVR